jgi:uncharacterized membrane-anchored protein
LILVQFSYLLVIAAINLLFVYFWNLKVKKKQIRGKKTWLLFIVCSLCTTWGLDALDRTFGIDTYFGVAQVAFSCWLVFVFATYAKTWAINKWSMKDFWIECGGELLSFFIMGFGVYIIT